MEKKTKIIVGVSFLAVAAIYAYLHLTATASSGDESGGTTLNGYSQHNIGGSGLSSLASLLSDLDAKFGNDTNTPTTTETIDTNGATIETVNTTPTGDPTQEANTVGATTGGGGGSTTYIPPSDTTGSGPKNKLALPDSGL